MLKQRLAVLVGEKPWAHRGVSGTTYDQGNPGLSNKKPTQLVYAQLLVSAKNIGLFDSYNNDCLGVVSMLSRIDPDFAIICENLEQIKYIRY